MSINLNNRAWATSILEELKEIGNAYEQNSNEKLLPNQSIRPYDGTVVDKNSQVPIENYVDFTDIDILTGEKKL